MKKKAHSFGRVLKQLLRRNKFELAILGIYYTAILVGGEFARSAVVSAIESLPSGPHNVYTHDEMELLYGYMFLRDYVIPLSQVSLAFIPLISAVPYIHREYTRRKKG